MANEQNLIPYGKGNRSESEEREMRSRGGKRSGETRRRKAALRDTMNRLLTMQVEVDGLSDILRSDGGESTYEEPKQQTTMISARKVDSDGYLVIWAYGGGYVSGHMLGVSVSICK